MYGDVVNRALYICNFNWDVELIYLLKSQQQPQIKKHTMEVQTIICCQNLPVSSQS